MRSKSLTVILAVREMQRTMRWNLVHPKPGKKLNVLRQEHMDTWHHAVQERRRSRGGGQAVHQRWVLPGNEERGMQRPKRKTEARMGQKHCTSEFCWGGGIGENGTIHSSAGKWKAEIKMLNGGEMGEVAHNGPRRPTRKASDRVLQGKKRKTSPHKGIIYRALSWDNGP